MGIAEEKHCGEERGERELHVSPGLLKPTYFMCMKLFSVGELSSSSACVALQKPMFASALLTILTEGGHHGGMWEKRSPYSGKACIQYYIVPYILATSAYLHLASGRSCVGRLWYLHSIG